MKSGSDVKLRGERAIRKRIITLVFDGTSGPMQFEVARTDLSRHERPPHRDHRSHVRTR